MKQRGSVPVIHRQQMAPLTVVKAQALHLLTFFSEENFSNFLISRFKLLNSHQSIHVTIVAFSALTVRLRRLNQNVSQRFARILICISPLERSKSLHDGTGQLDIDVRSAACATHHTCCSEYF